MAPPAAMPHETHHLCDSLVTARTNDQHLTVSAAAAMQVSSRHHPDGADSALHHYQSPQQRSTEVPLQRRPAPKLNPAMIMGAAHTAAKGPEALLLHHQQAAAAGQAIDSCMCEKERDDGVGSEDMGAPVAVRRVQKMVNRGSSTLIHRIDNPTSRQVTFSKRRNGLLKKAYELSVLCDAEVGVIIFSATGRPYEFASSSMPKILERYQEYSIGLPSRQNLFQDVEFWRREVILLRDQIFHRKNLESYMLGENLLSLSLNDIQKIEHKLEIALSKIRVLKAQILHAETQEAHRREARLKEENDLLKRKLSELTTLHSLREQMLMRNEARKMPYLGGDMTTLSMYQSSTLAREQECPSASPTFINRGIDEPLKLQLGLELFPTKPAE